jgi:hypothetical protein
VFQAAVAGTPQLMRVDLSVEMTIHTALENIVDEQRQSLSPVTEH